jgi:serine/threonine protein kinase
MVEGRTLRQLLGSERLEQDVWLALAVQIADGLAKAHAAGIVHRDLKPENVMVTPERIVKILDFGLAQLGQPSGDVPSSAPTDDQLTRPGQLLGTLGYMSPEQASGGRVDARSDQFALGVMLYELACGRHPFRRGTARETLTALLNDNPEPIGRLRPELPSQLHRLVERCLAKDPDERYASTRDLAVELRSLREYQGARRAPEGAGGRPRRVSAWAVALIALALVAAGLAARWLNRRATPGSARIESLAVLPLRRACGRPRSDHRPTRAGEHRPPPLGRKLRA